MTRIALICVLALGCGKDTARPAQECPEPRTCPECATCPPVTAAAAVVGRWWEEPGGCPDGFRLTGGPPPQQVVCSDEHLGGYRQTSFHPDGTPQQDDRDGEGYSSWTEWHRSGRLHYVGTETDRFLHWKQWRDDGSLQAEAVFYTLKGGGWQDGTVTYWDATGKITKVEPHRGGKEISPR